MELISIQIIDADKVWRNHSVPGIILDFLLENPFGTFIQMDLDDDEYLAVDKEDALAQLRKENKVHIAFKASDPHQLEAIITKNQEEQNSVHLNLAPEYLDTMEPMEFIHYFLESLAMFPITQYAFIQPTPDPLDFHAEMGIMPVASMFGQSLAWVHYISHSAYKDFYSRETLENAPVHAVKFFKDNSVMLMLYDDPLAYRSDEVIEKLKELAAYFNFSMIG